MFPSSHKSKHYWSVALKVLLLGATFGYIYYKLTQTDSLSLETFAGSLQGKNYGLLFVFLLAACFNWILEILKWKTLVNTFRPLLFKEAAQQSLAAHSLSLATPNRIGEYGAKAYFFRTPERKRILLLNLFSNASQMLATLFFGIIGLAWMVVVYGLEFSTIKVVTFMIVVCLLAFLGYEFKEKELLVKGLSLSKIMVAIKTLPRKAKWKTVFYAMGRYVCFSLLFAFMLQFFSSSISLKEATPIIWAMYLLVSIIPTVFLFDVIVRGGIAVWLFSMDGVPELPVLSTVLLMWLLNVALPAVIGSFPALSYKKVSA